MEPNNYTVAEKLRWSEQIREEVARRRQQQQHNVFRGKPQTQQLPRRAPQTRPAFGAGPGVQPRAAAQRVRKGCAEDRQSGVGCKERVSLLSGLVQQRLRQSGGAQREAVIKRLVARELDKRLQTLPGPNEETLLAVLVRKHLGGEGAETDRLLGNAVRAELDKEVHTTLHRLLVAGEPTTLPRPRRTQRPPPKEQEQRRACVLEYDKSWRQGMKHPSGRQAGDPPVGKEEGAGDDTVKKLQERQQELVGKIERIMQTVAVLMESDGPQEEGVDTEAAEAEIPQETGRETAEPEAQECTQLSSHPATTGGLQTSEGQRTPDGEQCTQDDLLSTDEMHTIHHQHQHPQHTHHQHHHMHPHLPHPHHHHLHHLPHLPSHDTHHWAQLGPQLAYLQFHGQLQPIQQLQQQQQQQQQQQSRRTKKKQQKRREEQQPPSEPPPEQQDDEDVEEEDEDEEEEEDAAPENRFAERMV